MTVKDKIIVYLYNKTNQLELEKQQINDIRRYRPMDSIDYYEILRSDLKIECWNEFINDIMRLIITNYPQGNDKAQLYKMNILYN